MQNPGKSIAKAFAMARERYADFGVDAERALRRLRQFSISIHCWQGDDVRGFEPGPFELGGGLAVTGSYPGRARTANELRSDLEQALALIPGKHRVNLHASYGEFGSQRVDRNQIGPEHFGRWIEWAKEQKLGLDFNPTFFGHPRAADGLTLAHPDKAIRQFWIEHGKRSREIGAAFGKALVTPCITNFWIPDGYKDTPADRAGPRERLTESLDTIFANRISPGLNHDSLEPKLFGIGSESYVVGSHEFYLGYAITRKKLLCLDSGHFHPTESIADKISAVLQFVPEILLHVSRGVRWDSDHVVTFTEELQATAREIAANGLDNRVHIGLDYFDATINRVAAWIIGSRAVLRALLQALLEPTERLRSAEKAKDYTTRLALQEECKAMPAGAVWDYYCEEEEVPMGEQWISEVKRYEQNILVKR